VQDKVFIIGGGPSLKNFDFNRLKEEDTIVTNVAVFDVPNPNYFITVDYTFLKKMVCGRLFKFSRLNIPKIFVADLHYDFMKEIDDTIVDLQHRIVYDLSVFNKVIKAKREDGIGYTYDDFRTGLNSGYSAFQLAVILGYKEIYLMGIDLAPQRDTHYHRLYSKSKSSFDKLLKKYCGFFRQGIEQLIQEKPEIKVYSCSSVCPLNDIIPYVPLERIGKC